SELPSASHAPGLQRGVAEEVADAAIGVAGGAVYGIVEVGGRSRPEAELFSRAPHNRTWRPSGFKTPWRPSWTRGDLPRLATHIGPASAPSPDRPSGRAGCESTRSRDWPATTPSAKPRVTINVRGCTFTA